MGMRRKEFSPTLPSSQGAWAGIQNLEFKIQHFVLKSGHQTTVSRPLRPQARDEGWQYG